MRAEPPAIIEALTRVSVDASWWPGARARGEYGWVELDLVAGPLERIRFRADVGPVRPGEGFGWAFTAGPMTGRAEWWLEAVSGGTSVHHLLDADAGRSGIAGPRTIHRRYRWALRRGMNGLKDALELKGGAARAAYHGSDDHEAVDRSPGL